jgi:hypothetical protein
MLFSSATPATTLGHPGKCSHLKLWALYRSGTAIQTLSLPQLSNLPQLSRLIQHNLEKQAGDRFTVKTVKHEIKDLRSLLFLASNEQCKC